MTLTTMINLTIYLPALLLILMSIFMVFRNWSKVQKDLITKKEGKFSYTIIVLILGLFIANFMFLALMSFFNLPSGHGLVLVTTPLLHLIISIVLIVVGRIIIGWEKMIF